jgi:hypothetical protein
MAVKSAAQHMYVDLLNILLVVLVSKQSSRWRSRCFLFNSEESEVWALQSHHSTFAFVQDAIIRHWMHSECLHFACRAMQDRHA